MACTDCTQRNPATPPYSKAKPVTNPACVGCTGNDIPIIAPSNQGKLVEILEGPGINVEDLSDANTYRFRISADVFTALEAALSIIAKEGVTTKANPVLKGTVISEVTLDWAYNKVVTAQSLTNNGGLPAPTLTAGIRQHIYSGQSIINNIDFTLQGNDGQGQPGSIDSDVESIIFGNNAYWGNTTSRIGQLATSLNGLLAGFSKQVKTSRNSSVFATGGVNQHFLFLYPKSMGLAVFTKGIFEGGFVRLKNVLGTLKSELVGSDVEIDINLTNEKGYSEAYYAYQTLFDNQNDPVTPIIVT